MQRTLVLLNGRGGAGKTTTGQALVKSLESAAFFDFDSLTVVNPWEYGEQLIQLGIRNSAALIRSFFDSNYRFVVMSSGCGSEQHVRYLLENLKVPTRIVWVYLNVSLEQRNHRRQLRNRDDADDPKWFEFLEEKLGPYKGPLTLDGVESYELDANGLNEREVVDRLIKRVAG